MSQTSDKTPKDAEKSLFESPPIAEQERMVEAIIFAATEPLSVAELTKRMPHGCDPAEALVCLRKRYEGRGVVLKRIGDAWAFRTAADLGYLMLKETVEQRKLSRAAIETLAIVAVSRGTVDLLIELDWIRFGRRRMSPGRPVTFVVTEHFLDHFGLESARDLPGLKDLRAAGLLDSRPFGVSADTPDDEGDGFLENAGQSELFED